MNIENYHRVSLEKTDNFQNPTKFLTFRELDLGFLGRAIQACTSYQNCRTQAPDSALKRFRSTGATGSIWTL
jgi:hypothetical protein